MKNRKILLGLCLSLFATLSTSCSKNSTIKQSYINENGELVVEYQNGNLENLGKVRGEKGLTGDTGETGPQGPQGEQGQIGAKGPQGIQGTQGISGTNGLIPEVGQNGNWWIGEVDTNVKVTGEQGQTGVSGITPFIGQNGNWWIGEVDTNVKAAGVNGSNGSVGIGVDHIETSYENDLTDGKEYYVFKIYYTDNSYDTKKVEVPKKIKSIEYIGAKSFELIEEGNDPILKLKVINSDNTTKVVDITEDMYVIDTEFVKPNFKVRGTYNVKVCYKGLNTTFDIKVVNPELITSIEYVSNDRYVVCTEDNDPTLQIEVTYDDSEVDVVDITEDMYVIDTDFVKPNFQVVGEYTSKINYLGLYTTFTIVIEEERPADLLVSSDEFIKGCYYNSGSLKTDGVFGKIRTHEEFITPQKIKVVAEDKANDVSTQPYKLVFSAYNASGEILNPDAYSTAMVEFENGVAELDLTKAYPTAAKFRVDVMIFTAPNNFVDIPSTAKINVYSLNDPTKYVDKTIDILGDSITAQANYFSKLKSLTGAKTIINNGLSGDKIVSFSSRIGNLSDNADAIIVFGGTNDYWHKNVNIGTIDDTSGTFYGGLNQIYNGLKTNFPDKDLLFVFPPHQTFSGKDDSNDFGHGTLDDFRTAMRTFCEVKGIKFCDLNEIEGWNPATHSSDGVHINGTGGALVAEKIYESLVSRA